MAEQLIRNEQVDGSIPFTSSKLLSVSERSYFYILAVFFQNRNINYASFA